MDMKDQNDTAILPEGSFETVLQLVQAEVAIQAEGASGVEPGQKLLGTGVIELLAIQIVFPLVVSIAGRAAYDVLKAQFLSWRERHNATDLASGFLLAPTKLPVPPMSSYKSHSRRSDSVRRKLRGCRSEPELH